MIIDPNVKPINIDNKLVLCFSKRLASVCRTKKAPMIAALPMTVRGMVSMALML